MSGCFISLMLGISLCTDGPSHFGWIEVSDIPPLGLRGLLVFIIGTFCCDGVGGEGYCEVYFEGV